MDDAADHEIAAGFRAWLELAPDATPDEMWAARPARVAVHRRLRAEPNPIDFIETLLRSATHDHATALTCEAIQDLDAADHPRHLRAF